MMNSVYPSLCQASTEAAVLIQAHSRIAASLVYVVHVFLLGWVLVEAQRGPGR